MTNIIQKAEAAVEGVVEAVEEFVEGIIHGEPLNLTDDERAALPPLPPLGTDPTAPAVLTQANIDPPAPTLTPAPVIVSTDPPPAPVVAPPAAAAGT